MLHITQIEHAIYDKQRILTLIQLFLQEDENKAKSHSPTPILDDRDDDMLHDDEDLELEDDLEDMEENLYVVRCFQHTSLQRCFLNCKLNKCVLVFRSENDEEAMSETKIRLEDDDEGYDDDNQGNGFCCPEFSFLNVIKALGA